MKRILQAIVFIMAITFAHTANAQNFGINSPTPNASAALDVKSYTGLNQGVLIPSVTLTGTGDVTTIPSAATSLLVYNTATAGTTPNNVTPGYYYWNSSKWLRFEDKNIESAPLISSSLVLPDPSITTTTALTSGGSNTSTQTIDLAETTKTITTSGFSGTIADVTVNMNVSNGWALDVEAFLLSPSGKILELTTDNGSTSGGGYNVTFTDAAASNITSYTSGAATGNYRPEGSTTSSTTPTPTRTGTITSFAGLVGDNPNGTWTLVVRDDASGDITTFNSWSINISTTAATNWTLIGETSIRYMTGAALVIQSKYSGDPTDLNGVITSLTRSSATAGATGTTASSLPGTILDYSSASPSGTGNFWVSTTNLAREEGLVDQTVYYYQLWRRGNIETPTSSNENFSLIPMRITK